MVAHVSRIFEARARRHVWKLTFFDATSQCMAEIVESNVLRLAPFSPIAVINARCAESYLESNSSPSVRRDAPITAPGRFGCHTTHKWKSEHPHWHQPSLPKRLAESSPKECRFLGKNRLVLVLTLGKDGGLPTSCVADSYRIAGNYKEY